MSSILPQNIALTDEEERMLDEINASMANEAEMEPDEEREDEHEQQRPRQRKAQRQRSRKRA